VQGVILIDSNHKCNGRKLISVVIVTSINFFETCSRAQDVLRDNDLFTSGHASEESSSFQGVLIHTINLVLVNANE
jgi:hypothetical protein